jgi:hypothetical protein
MFFVQLFVLFILAFLFALLFFGSLMLLLGIALGSSYNLIAQTLMNRGSGLAYIATLFGGLWAGAFFYANKKAYSKLGKLLPNEPLHQLELIIEQDISHAFSTCLNALEHIHTEFRSIESNALDYTITR